MSVEMKKLVDISAGLHEVKSFAELMDDAGKNVNRIDHVLAFLHSDFAKIKNVKVGGAELVHAWGMKYISQVVGKCMTTYLENLSIYRKGNGEIHQSAEHRLNVLAQQCQSTDHIIDISGAKAFCKRALNDDSISSYTKVLVLLLQAWADGNVIRFFTILSKMVKEVAGHEKDSAEYKAFYKAFMLESFQSEELSSGDYPATQPLSI